MLALGNFGEPIPVTTNAPISPEQAKTLEQAKAFNSAVVPVLTLVGAIIIFKAIYEMLQKDNIKWPHKSWKSDWPIKEPVNSIKTIPYNETKKPDIETKKPTDGPYIWLDQEAQKETKAYYMDCRKRAYTMPIEELKTIIDKENGYATNLQRVFGLDARKLNEFLKDRSVYDYQRDFRKNLAKERKLKLTPKKEFMSNKKSEDINIERFTKQNPKGFYLRSAEALKYHNEKEARQQGLAKRSVLYSISRIRDQLNVIQSYWDKINFINSPIGGLHRGHRKREVLGYIADSIDTILNWRKKAEETLPRTFWGKPKGEKISILEKLFPKIKPDSIEWQKILTSPQEDNLTSIKEKIKKYEKLSFKRDNLSRKTIVGVRHAN